MYHASPKDLNSVGGGKVVGKGGRGLGGEFQHSNFLPGACNES